MTDNHITFNRKKWSNFVDIVTIIWLIIFIIGFFTSEQITHYCNILNMAILIVFITDLVILFIYFENRKKFIRKHWLDILMVIPYLRIFRIFRIFRVLKFTRVLKTARTIKIAKHITKSRKAIKLTKGTKSLTISHEIYDLFRTIKGRLFNIKSE